MRPSVLVIGLLLGCGATTAPVAHTDPTRRAPAVSNTPAEPGMLPAPPDLHTRTGATRTASGLMSRVLRPGSGTVHPTPASTVTVHYTGWSMDGRMIDSSRTRGEPATFPLTALIPGWVEGIPMMVVGEERRFWIPGALAYGDAPSAGRPTGPLVFDVELIAIH